jgi:hypothetical protein
MVPAGEARGLPVSGARYDPEGMRAVNIQRA